MEGIQQCDSGAGWHVSCGSFQRLPQQITKNWVASNNNNVFLYSFGNYKSRIWLSAGPCCPWTSQGRVISCFWTSLWWFLTPSIWLTGGFLYFFLWSYRSLTAFFISVPRITPTYKEMVSQWLGAHHHLPRLHFYLLAFMKTVFLNEVTFIATMVRVYTTPGGSEFNPFRSVCRIPVSVSMLHSFL